MPHYNQEYADRVAKAAILSRWPHHNPHHHQRKARHWESRQNFLEQTLWLLRQHQTPEPNYSRIANLWHRDHDAIHLKLHQDTHPYWGDVRSDLYLFAQPLSAWPRPTSADGTPLQIDDALFQRLYGLTLREAEVLVDLHDANHLPGFFLHGLNLRAEVQFRMLRDGLFCPEIASAAAMRPVDEAWLRFRRRAFYKRGLEPADRAVRPGRRMLEFILWCKQWIDGNEPAIRRAVRRVLDDEDAREMEV
jgi:hypothetical protein